MNTNYYWDVRRIEVITFFRVLVHLRHHHHRRRRRPHHHHQLGKYSDLVWHLNVKRPLRKAMSQSKHMFHNIGYQNCMERSSNKHTTKHESFISLWAAWVGI